MNIGIFTPYNFEKPGGVQDHVMAQFHELTKRGHMVKIITQRPRKHIHDAPKDTIFIGRSARIKAQSSTVDISSTIDQSEVDELYASNQFDVVHFHEPTVPLASMQLIASCPYPVVATLHAALPDTAIGKTLGTFTPYFRSILQHVDILTRVSPVAGEYLSDLIEEAAIETRFVANGIRLDDYSYHGKFKRNSQTILFIGRLEKRKGPRLLLDAYQLLKCTMPGVSLVIAGDGPDRKKLIRYIEKYNIQDVQMLGYVTEAKKIRLLRSASLASFPAIYGESFGIVLLEAMACEIPIVAGNNPGYKSVMAGRGLLSLIDPQDAVEFAERMELMLTDTDIRKLMIDWGKNHVKQFDYKNIVDKYEQIYQDAINLKR